MSFLKRVFALVNQLLPAEDGHAHCDIPCGIYDPHTAQIAALTTVRMNQLMRDLETPGPDTPGEKRHAFVAAMGRYVAEKERHAELCKHELRILWGDYFKPEHLQQHPDLHDKFFNAMKLASTVRQNNDLKAAEELLAAVQDIAEIFWKTKGAGVSRQPSRQAVGGELVYPA
ncbi:MAG: superoxide dismutase, Ni [Dehalococcoidia bacterium]